MKPYPLPRRDSLIGLLPSGYRAKRTSRTGRIVDQFRRMKARIAAWSELVHWTTVADAMALGVFFLAMWGFYWAAWIMGWLD